MIDADRIPHALLLEGMPGIGKFALARAAAQYIHCTNRTPDGDSCGVCPACLQHQSHNHIDTIYSFPVVKKNSKATISNDYAAEFHDYLDREKFMEFDAWMSALSTTTAQPVIYVEEISSLIDRVNLKARQSKYKVVLMWLPERLRPEAANKMLKIIEEPYPDTIFILTSGNPRGILPTIYSRTQRIAVSPYSDSEIEAMLESELAVDPTVAQAAAALAEGSYTAATHLVSIDGERRKFMALFINLMRAAWQRRVKDLREWSVSVAALGREGSLRFYQYCARMIGENYIYNIGDDNLIAMTADEKAFSSKFAPFINERNVEALLSLFNEACTDTQLNANGKIIAFDLAVKTILLLKK